MIVGISQTGIEARRKQEVTLPEIINKFPERIKKIQMEFHNITNKDIRIALNNVSIKPEASNSEINIVISGEVENKKVIVSKKAKEDKINFSINGVGVILQEDIVLGEKGIDVANKKLIILPDEAKKIIEKEIPETKNIKLQIKNGLPVYFSTKNKNANLFGFIPVEFDVSINVDAQTGVQSIEKPWWSFLAI